jgi:hypothetical protein
MLNWFLVFGSVATYGFSGSGPVGPLTEESCRAAEAVLLKAALDVRCRRVVAMTVTNSSCGPDGGINTPGPWVARAVPIFEGDPSFVGMAVPPK